MSVSPIVDPSDSIDYRILGPLEVASRGQPVELGRPKQRALLALLLLHANQPVPLDRVIDLLWGPEPPDRACGDLQVHVSRLRRTLEPGRPTRTPSQVLRTVAGGYLLRVGAGDLDADRFETLADRGRRLLGCGRPADARDALDEALALWRGPALAEFAYEPFAQQDAARLEERRILAAEDRFEAQIGLGRHAEAVAGLEALVAANGLRERRWELLVLALYRSGRQADALRAFSRARGVLAGELGLEPGVALRRLEADVLAQAPHLDWEPPAADGRMTSGPAPSGAPVRGRTAAVGPHGTPPLIGRARELAVLDRAFAGACTGRGRLVLLAGQAGIGKTRLASEAAASSAGHGAWTAWGRGTEVDGAPPSWFWSQIIRALLAVGEPDELRRALGPGAAEIARIVPEVTELSGDTARPWPADPATARFRLYEAVVAFLGRLAARRPLVLVLDDLHWADVPSLELTELLVQRLPDLPILLIVTYRDREAAAVSAVTITLGALARSSVLDRLPLAGFSELEVAAFVAQATGLAPASELVAAVYARTEGNPFFVAELARSLTGEGGLDDPATSVRKVPSGIKDVLRRRAGALPGPTRTLLAIAAVAGREFDLALVATASDVALDQAVELLDPAVAVGLVDEDPQAVGRYRFSHVLVRDAIYDEIVGLRRARLHGRVGDAVAERDDDSLGLVTELARHFHLAAPAVGPAPGRAAAIRAAEAAVAVLAFEQGEAYLKQALDLVATMTPGEERDRQELELQLRIGSLISRSRGRSWPDVAAAFNRAQQLCGRIGLTADHLRTLWGQFFVAYMTADLEGAAAVGAQLLDLGRRAGDPRCELAGLIAVGTSKFYLGQLVEARSHLAQAASLSDTLADPSLVDLFIQDPRVASRNLLVLATWLLGDYDGADDVVAEQVRVIEAVDHPQSELAALVCHGWLRLMQRDPVRLEEVCARTLSLAEQLGHRPLSLAIGMHQGWAIAHRGAPQAGASLVRRKRDDLDALRMAAARPCFLGMLAEAELLDGRPEAALAAIDAALEEVGRRGDRFYLPELHRVKGEILLTSGSDADAVAARACFQQALDEAEAQGALALRDRAARSLAGILAPAPRKRRGNQVASAPGMLA